MKQHTTSFKNEIKLLGKQQKVQIIYGENVLDEENINSVNFYYQGDLLKSIMKGLNIDSNINIPKDTELALKYGLLINGEYEYLDYGKFIVYDVEKQEDTNSYAITCYDKLLYSMKDYEAMDITYPITVENYLKAICRHLGLEYEEKEIANGRRVILNELYLSDGDSLDYTFRDVLDEISQVTAGTICINKDDKLEVRYVNDTGDTIDEEYLKDINVNFGEKYGKINGVVLSRSAGADNVYLVDDASVKENGLCEIKISDNQIMNFNDRSDYLPEILEKVNGIEYYINDFSSTGIMYYDLLDSYNVQIGDKTYKCLMLNDEINITQGLEELVYTEMPEVSETDYTKADKTDRRLKQTYIIADKANQKVKALVSDLNEAGYGSFAELVIDINSIKTSIGVAVDLTKTVSGINPITLEKCMQGEIQNLTIKANNSIFNPLYPSSTLYPNPTLYPRSNTKIYIIHQEVDENDLIIETTKVIELKLNSGLKMYNTEIYDEFVYTASVNEGVSKGQVIRRVGTLEDGTLYPLTIEQIEYVEIEDIILEKGTNIITFSENHYGNVSATYVQQNSFTSMFATTYEVNSYITQLANEIDLMVKEKVGKDEVIADLNIAIKDGQGIIEFVANTISWKSDNSELTPDGKIYLKAGEIAGLIMQQNSRGDSWLYKNFQSSTGQQQSGIYIPKNTNGNAQFLYAGVPAGQELVYAKSFFQHNGNLYFRSGYLSMMYAPIKNADGSYRWNNAMSFLANGTWRYLENGNSWSYEGISYLNGIEDGYGLWIYDAKEYIIKDGVHEQLLARFIRTGNNNEPSEVWFYGGCWIDENRSGTGYRIVTAGNYNEIINASDKNLKENIKDSTIDALKQIEAINHKSFTWNEEAKKYDRIGDVKLGYIAQELEEIDEELVVKSPIDETYSINHLALLARATKAIQQLSNENKELREENKRINNELSNLQERLLKLEEKIGGIVND